jgi:hypothetical protein
LLLVSRLMANTETILTSPLVVYDIKCILDDILNFCENVTDGIINDLQPALEALIGTASTMSCHPGVKLLGFCI